MSKGWHVAPSINQDNHSGDWVTSNDCRTAVLAKELTREGIFEAVKSLCVYATHDKNLRVKFNINGNIMGSIIQSSPKLDISIESEDPNDNDIITKVEIIGNGKIIVASAGFNTRKVTWNTSIKPSCNYYYAKITQKDGNIAITSPIWVED